MKKIILMLGIVMILLISGCTNESKCLKNIGIIKDFDISAGGFGQPSLAKIYLDNDRILVIKGKVTIGSLEVGKCLYELCECNWEYPNCWKIAYC